MIIKITINYESKFSKEFFTEYLFFVPTDLQQIIYNHKIKGLYIWTKNEKKLFDEVINYKIEEIGG